MDAGNGAFSYYGAVPWGQLTPEQRLQFAMSQPGSGIELTQMAQQQAMHPERQQSNYWDKLMGAVANNSSKLPVAHVPGAKSGIGMMSGDAGQDIGNAAQQTTVNYGSDPRQDYIPTGMTAALNDPNATPEQVDAAKAVGAKQAAREQEWQAHQGEALGGITGTTDAFIPGAGKESRAIAPYGQDGMSASEKIRQQYLNWQRIHAARGGQ